MLVEQLSYAWDDSTAQWVNAFKKDYTDTINCPGVFCEEGPDAVFYTWNKDRSSWVLFPALCPDSLRPLRPSNRDEVLSARTPCDRYGVGTVGYDDFLMTTAEHIRMSGFMTHYTQTQT